MTFNDILQGDQLQARLPRIARGRAVVRSRVPRLSRDWRRLSLVAR